MIQDTRSFGRARSEAPWLKRFGRFYLPTSALGVIVLLASAGLCVNAPARNRPTFAFRERHLRWRVPVSRVYDSAGGSDRAEYQSTVVPPLVCFLMGPAGDGKRAIWLRDGLAEEKDTPY